MNYLILNINIFIYQDMTYKYTNNFENWIASTNHLGSFKHIKLI